MTRLRTILVPIDFSPGSYAAAERARELAEVFNSHVHLLHVAPPPAVPLCTVGPQWQEPQTLQKPICHEALDRLATLSVRLGFYPVRTTGVVRVGRPEVAIGEYAEQIQADLIVMGIHGNHTVPVGDVIEHVLGRTRRAVLAVPDDDGTTLSVEQLGTAFVPVAC